MDKIYDKKHSNSLFPPAPCVNADLRVILCVISAKHKSIADLRVILCVILAKHKSIDLGGRGTGIETDGSTVFDKIFCP